jgi:hypothetical protein
MKKHLMRLALITKHIMDANKMDALKAHDRLANHLIRSFGDLASHKLKEIQDAIDDHNEKHGLRNAA